MPAPRSSTRAACRPRCSSSPPTRATPCRAAGAWTCAPGARTPASSRSRSPTPAPAWTPGASRAPSSRSRRAAMPASPRASACTSSSAACARPAAASRSPRRPRRAPPSRFICRAHELSGTRARGSRMNDVRRRLLELHKALVDVERESYERARGRMTDGEFLKALIEDPAFAWLGPLTALIVRLDEMEGDDVPRDYKAEIKRLLKPDELGLA